MSCHVLNKRALVVIKCTCGVEGEYLITVFSHCPTTSHHKRCNKLSVTFREFLCRPTDELAPASELVPSVTGTCPLYGNKCDITAGISRLYGQTEV